MKTAQKIWKYMGVNVYPASTNSSGIRWYALTAKGILRADTKSGIRELIKES